MSQYWEGQKGGGYSKRPATPKPKPKTKAPPAPTPATPTPTQSTAKAVVDNATRLGLKWEMRSATVYSLSNTATAQQVRIIYDGDTQPVTAVSTAGIVLPSTRVLAISTPPSGNFIIGVLGGQTQSNLVAVARNTLTVSQTVTTVETPVTGSDLTISGLTGTWSWEVFATYDFLMTVAGTTQVFGKLIGPNGTEGSPSTYGFTGVVNQRATVFQSFNGTNATGDASFQLSVVKSAASGTVQIHDTATTYLVKIYQ